MEQHLIHIRTNLLELHRVLIELERDALQREEGPIAPGAFLQLLLEDARFAWLRPMSGLIVDIDETIAQARKANISLLPDITQPLLDRVSTMFSVVEGEPEFTARYLEWMRQSPTVTMLHSEITNAKPDATP